MPRISNYPWLNHQNNNLRRAQISIIIPQNLILLPVSLPVQFPMFLFTVLCPHILTRFKYALPNLNPDFQTSYHRVPYRKLR